MFKTKYVLIPVLITCVYVIAMAVAGMETETIVGLIPILLIGHMLGYVMGMHHIRKNQNLKERQSCQMKK